MQPDISIITATRDAMAHLPVLAQAILRQPPGLVEWIVIDSVSSDGTVEFLSSIDDSRLVWISEADSGIYDAWNKGVNRARGRWIIFLGADDVVDDQWLEACAHAPSVDLLYGDLEMRDASGQFLTVVHPGTWEEVKPQMRFRMMLPHPGMAHNRALFASRRFDAGFRIAGDFNFLAGAGIESALRLPLRQAVMRLGGVSNRPDRTYLAYSENLRVVTQHGGRMMLRDRLNWMLKRGISRIAPSFFFSLQKMRWRLRRKL